MSAGAPTSGVSTQEGPVSTRTVTIRRDQGLHARPALALVKVVQESGAVVTITGVNHDAVDAGSILAVMAGGFSRGAEVLLTVTGAGADDVLERAAAIVGGV